MEQERLYRELRAASDIDEGRETLGEPSKAGGSEYGQLIRQAPIDWEQEPLPAGRQGQISGGLPQDGLLPNPTRAGGTGVHWGTDHVDWQPLAAGPHARQRFNADRRRPQEAAAGWEGPHPPPPRAALPPKLAIMNFPKFKGGNALERVFKAELFYDYQEIPEEQWVRLASFHLEEAAFQWTQWFLRGRVYAPWRDFFEGFTTRFGPFEALIHIRMSTLTSREA